MMGANDSKEVRMNKRARLTFFLAAFFLAVVFLLAETVIVKIQSTNLRQEPKFYSVSLAVLRAGENLTKVTQQGDWIQVRTSAGATGWIHSSAVETKKFNLLAMDKGLKTQASASEVALASKGFNKQVEQSYRSKHAEANFAAVDKMLLLKVQPMDVEAFLKKGKLGEFGGPK